MIQMLSVEYILYHAFLNDCILFKNKYVYKVGMTGTINKKQG
jgi:hypothetical protein